MFYLLYFCSYLDSGAGAFLCSSEREMQSCTIKYILMYVYAWSYGVYLYRYEHVYILVGMDECVCLHILFIYMNKYVCNI